MAIAVFNSNLRRNTETGRFASESFRRRSVRKRLGLIPKKSIKNECDQIYCHKQPLTEVNNQSRNSWEKKYWNSRLQAEPLCLKIFFWSETSVDFVIVLHKRFYRMSLKHSKRVRVILRFANYRTYENRLHTLANWPLAKRLSCETTDVPDYRNFCPV